QRVASGKILTHAYELALLVSPFRPLRRRHCNPCKNRRQQSRFEPRDSYPNNRCARLHLGARTSDDAAARYGEPLLARVAFPDLIRRGDGTILALLFSGLADRRSVAGCADR